MTAHRCAEAAAEAASGVQADHGNDGLTLTTRSSSGDAS